MKHRVIKLVPILLTLLLTVNSTSAQPDLVIKDINVVDVVNGKMIEGQDVVILGDRVFLIRKHSEGKVPFGARVLEGRGKYLIPGLWDMHVHLFDDKLTRDAFMPLFLAHGITGIREMSGDETHLRLRDEIEQGKAIGPRMVVGALVDGPNPWPGGWPELLTADAEEARKLVTRLHSEGYDFIKTYQFLSPSAYRSVHMTARGLGMEVSGEVPMSVSLWEAAAEGHRTVEHLTGVEFACSSEEEKHRLKFRALVEELSANKELKTHVSIWNPSEWEPLASIDPEKCRALYRHLAAQGTWVVPTLAIQKWTAEPDDPELLNDPRSALLPKRLWDPKGAAEFMDPEGRLRPVYLHRLSTLKDLHNAGIGILAGTDLLGGFLVHDEIAKFARVGLSDLEALRTATLNPAKYLGKENELGSVEVGKIADLVILDRNPLEDISNTRKIHAVVAKGRLFTRSDLVRLLAQAKEAVRKEDLKDEKK